MKLVFGADLLTEEIEASSYAEVKTPDEPGWLRYDMETAEGPKTRYVIAPGYLELSAWILPDEHYQSVEIQA